MYLRFFAGTCAALMLGTASGAAPIQWAGNGNFYEVVSDPLLAPDAEIAAEAMTFMDSPGYLATITSAAELSFVRDLLIEAGAFAGIIGLSDRETEGVFKYIGGPEEGLTASFLPWSSGEPNDCCGGEDYVELFTSTGTFNDILPPGEEYDASRPYVVEYSVSDPSVIPVPASLPLLLAGLGAFAVASKRRKNVA